MSPDWAQWEASAQSLPALDRAWIEELFTWKSRPFPPGEWLVFHLRNAARLALAGDVLGARAALDQARTVPPFIGFAYGHVATMIDTAASIVTAGALPDRVYAPPDEVSEWSEWKYRPLPESEQVTADKADAVTRLVATLQAEQSPEDYAASREAALAVVRADIASGKLQLSKAPELAMQAESARAQVLALEAERRAELEDLAQQRDQAEARVAVLRGNARPQVDGLGSEIKRAAKKLERELRRAVDPIRDLRDQLSEALLPGLVREFGRDIENEVHRLGARVNAELRRAVAGLAQYGSFLQVAGLVLGLVIPGVGQLIDIVIAAALAGVEIAHAQYQSNEIEAKFRQMRAVLTADIARLMAEAAELEAQAAELEGARLEQLRLAEEERARRQEILTAAAAQRSQADAKSGSVRLAIGGLALVVLIAALTRRKKR